MLSVDEEATAFLSLSLDDCPLRLARRAATLDAAGDLDERLSVRVELRADQPLPRGDHRLHLEDRHKDRRVRLHLSIALAPNIQYRTPSPSPPA